MQEDDKDETNAETLDLLPSAAAAAATAIQEDVATAAAVSTDPLVKLIATANPEDTSVLKYMPFYQNKSSDKFSIPVGIQKDAIVQSLWQNMPFYFVLIACMYWLSSGTSFIITLITVILVSLYSFGMHYASHHLLVLDWYNRFDNIITRNSVVGGCLRLICQFTDSHATVHHDSLVNKRWYNILSEFVNNAISQGGMLIILKYLLQKANAKAILFWSLFYPTVRHLNGRFLQQEPHTNHFMDLWNILIGTKNDWTTLESHNHAIINAVVITAVIVVVSRWW